MTVNEVVINFIVLFLCKDTWNQTGFCASNVQ
jgi:hypothetical protein